MLSSLRGLWFHFLCCMTPPLCSQLPVTKRQKSMRGKDSLMTKFVCGPFKWPRCLVKQLWMGAWIHLHGRVPMFGKHKDFSTFVLWTLWPRSLFAVEVCPVHCWVLSKIPGFNPQDASSMPHSGTSKMSPDMAKCPWVGGQSKPL